MRPRFLLLAVALAAVLAPYRRAAAAPLADTEDPLVAGFPAFAGWFRAHGGAVDDRVAVGRHAPRPGVTIRGLVATAAVPAGTRLMSTPASLFLAPPALDDGGCGLAVAVRRELELGTASRWHAYLAFDDSVGSRVPSEWDRARGPGSAVRELQGLPPAGDTHRHVDWYQKACLHGRDMADLDWQVLKMFLTRAADIGLVPMYDLMNHHNGLINTELKREASGALGVYALADIPAGDPIYNTYARAGGESSVDVFNTYGFVDGYPQLWAWSDDDEGLARRAEDPWERARRRFGRGCAEAPRAGDGCRHVEPNTAHHEVLVVSPTLAALLPSKGLVQPLGNARRSAAEWEGLVAAHHANLRASHARALGAAAAAVLGALPTTLEEDEVLIPMERRRHEEAKGQGTVDVNKADAIQAIEYRVAFKKALTLAMGVAEGGSFFDDSEEL